MLCYKCGKHLPPGHAHRCTGCNKMYHRKCLIFVRKKFGSRRFCKNCLNDSQPPVKKRKMSPKNKSSVEEIKPPHQVSPDKEEKKPLTKEEKKPLTKEERKPLTIEEKKPLTIEEKKPLTIDEKKPLTVYEKKPLSVDERKLLTTEERKPLTTEEKKALTLEETKLLTVEEKEPLPAKEWDTEPKKRPTIEKEKSSWPSKLDYVYWRMERLNATMKLLQDTNEILKEDNRILRSIIAHLGVGPGEEECMVQVKNEDVLLKEDKKELSIEEDRISGCKFVAVKRNVNREQEECIDSRCKYFHSDHLQHPNSSAIPIYVKNEQTIYKPDHSTKNVCPCYNSNKNTSNDLHLVKSSPSPIYVKNEQISYKKRHQDHICKYEISNNEYHARCCPNPLCENNKAISDKEKECNQPNKFGRGPK